MARIKARIKPRPVVAQSRSDEKLKRAEARATEEREFARKGAAEIHALRTTHEERRKSVRKAANQRVQAFATELHKDAAEIDAMAAEVDALLATQDEEKMARKAEEEEEKMALKAEEKRRVTKEIVDQHFKNKSDRKERETAGKDEHMRTDEKKLEKLFEDQKEEARVQKAVDDAAEKHAVDHLRSFTAAVDTRRGSFTSVLTAAVDAMRTTHEEQARNRQEAASKKESGYTDAADGLRRASLEWSEQNAKLCTEEINIQVRLLEEKHKLLEQQEEFSESDSEDEV